MTPACCSPATSQTDVRSTLQPSPTHSIVSSPQGELPNALDAHQRPSSPSSTAASCVCDNPSDQLPAQPSARLEQLLGQVLHCQMYASVIPTGAQVRPQSARTCVKCDPVETPGAYACARCPFREVSLEGTSPCFKCERSFMRGDTHRSKCTCSASTASGFELVKGTCQSCKPAPFNDGLRDGPAVCRKCLAATFQEIAPSSDCDFLPALYVCTRRGHG